MTICDKDGEGQKNYEIRVTKFMDCPLLLLKPRLWLLMYQMHVLEYSEYLMVHVGKVFAELASK